MAEDLESRLAAIAHRYDLQSMYVFGSRARDIAALVAGETNDACSLPKTDDAPSEHDVDIGVEPHRRIRLAAKHRVMLTLELESLLEAPRVDLVMLPEAGALLAAEVVRGELIYTEDADAEAESQLYYLRRAGDLAPFYRRQWKELVGSDL